MHASDKPYVYMYAFACVSMHTCMGVCTHACVYSCAHVCKCINVFVNVYLKYIFLFSLASDTWMKKKNVD